MILQYKAAILQQKIEILPLKNGDTFGRTRGRTFTKSSLSLGRTYKWAVTTKLTVSHATWCDFIILLYIVIIFPPSFFLSLSFLFFLFSEFA